MAGLLSTGPTLSSFNGCMFACLYVYLYHCMFVCLYVRMFEGLYEAVLSRTFLVVLVEVMKCEN